MELGSVDAMVNLGFKYERGDGVKLDMKKAMQLYRLATDRGHAGAAYDVARQLSKARASGESSVDPMPYYLLAARKGHTSAEYVCGMWYERAAEDLEEAKRWYARAAAKGLKDAVAAVKRLGA